MNAPSIMFATPCYGAMVTAMHMRSCLELRAELTRAGLDHDWNIGWNDSLVNRARMEMTRSYLEARVARTGAPYSHMMWLDADIDFTPEDVSKLWNMQTDIAVGLYSMKRQDFPLSAWRNGKLVDLSECPDEPFEVDYSGTGFMLIAREVIEKLTEIHGTYAGPHGASPAIYMTPLHDGYLESEDYYFSRIAREAGFKIMADPSIKLGHWGPFRYGG